MSDKVFTPGGANVKLVTIINNNQRGINVVDIVESITLYEDISSPFITGKLEIIDATGILSALSFVGEELLLMSLSCPEYEGDTVTRINNREIFAHIYKMSNLEARNGKTLVYTLYFSSIESFSDMNTSISMTYKGKISETVNKLCTQKPGLLTEKEVLVEETANNFTHTSNFWSPTKNILFLASRALAANGASNYLFFENNEGFVFCSLDRLFSGPPVFYFKKDEQINHGAASQNDKNASDQTHNIGLEKTQVLDISGPVFYDYIDRKTHGFYGSTNLHVDITTKRLNQRVILPNEDLLRFNRLNEDFSYDVNKLQSNPESLRTLTVIQKEMYESMPLIPTSQFNRRMALLSQFSSFRIAIKVYGDVEYSVGRTVYLQVYKNAPLSAEEDQTQLDDTMLTGKYLITSISHEFGREGYFCNIELSKDSLIKKPYE